jgi:LPXTG-motif cell wall-anchored protein
MRRLMQLAALVGALAVAPVVALSAGAGAQTYPPSACTVGTSEVNVTPGQTITVSISGFAPSTQVSLALDGQALGSVTTDGSGAASATVTIPSNITPGTHTLSASGDSGVGGTCDPSTTLTVVGAAAGAPGAAAGRLAFTGSSDTMPLVWIGIAALTIGTALLIGLRRRANTRGHIEA